MHRVRVRESLGERTFPACWLESLAVALHPLQRHSAETNLKVRDREEALASTDNVGRFCETPRRLTQTPYSSSFGFRHWSFRIEVKQEPFACQLGHLFQCTWLLEQVRGAGDNRQLYFAAHLVARHFV
jgi:hypothetical protein